MIWCKKIVEDYLQNSGVNVSFQHNGFTTHSFQHIHHCKSSPNQKKTILEEDEKKKKITEKNTLSRLFDKMKCFKVKRLSRTYENSEFK